MAEKEKFKWMNALVVHRLHPSTPVLLHAVHGEDAVVMLQHAADVAAGAPVPGRVTVMVRHCQEDDYTVV
jgi:hypothetical protein